MACILQINKFNSTSGTLCAHHNEIALLSIEILLAQKLKLINVFLDLCLLSQSYSQTF